MIVAVQSEDWRSQVGTYAGSVVVIWGADYCTPYRRVCPLVEQAIAATGSKVRVVSVDVDQCQELALSYKVRGVPSFFVFQGGQCVERLLGSRTFKELSSLFSRLSL